MRRIEKDTIHKALLQRKIVEMFGAEVQKEYRFSPDRQWKADYYIPSLNLIIEYEGIFGLAPSRHTQIKGYCDDCIKYNAAVALGYRMLRYTMATYTKFEIDIETLKKHLTK